MNIGTGNDSLLETVGHPQFLSIMNHDELRNKLQQIPLILEEHRQLNVEQRLRLLYESMNQFYFPTSTHLDFAHRVSTLIQNSYVLQYPLTNPVVLKDEETRNFLSNERFINGVAFIGPPAIGKTCTLNRILELYNSEFIQQDSNSKQFTYVKLTCLPFDTTKRFCQRFFEEVNMQFDTNYTVRRNIFGNMTIAIPGVAQKHCLRLLVIDEFENIACQKQPLEMLSFLFGIIKSIGIPVVILGTSKSNEIGKDILDRIKEKVIWDRINNKNNEEWKQFINCLWKLQVTKNVTPLTQEFDEILFKESQGVFGLATHLFTLAQRKAIETRQDEIITSEILKRASSEIRGLI